MKLLPKLENQALVSLVLGRATSMYLISLWLVLLGLGCRQPESRKAGKPESRKLQRGFYHSKDGYLGSERRGKSGYYLEE